jgi:1-deoxy-D-xylulose-5-phosphate reductoisomerase
VLAPLGFPTMELPILYALTHPERLPDDGVRRFDPVAAGDLTFHAVDGVRFPAYRLGVQAGRTGGTAPAVFNAANEVAVAAFLRGQLSFGGIGDVITQVLDAHSAEAVTELETVLTADRWAREQTDAAVRNSC